MSMENDEITTYLWYGVIIGYSSGRCAKGVMRLIEIEEGTNRWLFERVDKRLFLLNMDSIAALMFDPLIPITTVNPQNALEVKEWYMDNVRKEND